MKILILSGLYPPEWSQNGNITRNLEIKLIKSGHDVFVMSGYYEDRLINEPNIKFVKRNHISTNIIIKLLYKIYYFIFKMSKLPDTDLSFTNRMIDNLSIVKKNFDFESVIAVSGPFSTISVLNKIKEKYENVKCICYCLDFISDRNLFKIIPSNIYIKYSLRKEKKYYEKLDHIFILSELKKYYLTNFYSDISKKFIFFELPTFDKENLIKKEIQFKNNITFMYAGSFSKKNRNPLIFIDFFNKLKNFIPKFEVLIYGKTADKSILNKIENTSFIKYCGVLTKEQLKNKLGSCDFLLNIGNKKNGNMIPSKIFEYFSYGLPVINFQQNKNDISIETIDKYPYSLNIKVWNKRNENMNLVKNFIQSHMNYSCDMDKVSIIFKNNTIEKNVELILNALKSL